MTKLPVTEPKHPPAYH